MSESAETEAAGMPDDFPVPVETFIASLKGTPDEVYGVLIRRTFKHRKMRMGDWPSVIEGFRNAPAHPAARV